MVCFAKKPNGLNRPPLKMLYFYHFYGTCCNGAHVWCTKWFHKGNYNFMLAKWYDLMLKKLLYILWCTLHRATSNKHYRRSRAINTMKCEGRQRRPDFENDNLWSVMALECLWTVLWNLKMIVIWWHCCTIYTTLLYMFWHVMSL